MLSWLGFTDQAAQSMLVWLLVLPGDCQTLDLGKQALIEAQPLGEDFVPALRLGNLSLSGFLVVGFPSEWKPFS